MNIHGGNSGASREWPHCAGLAQAAVCAAARLAPERLSRPGRGNREIAFARQIAMYLAHVGFGLSLTEVGRSFGRDRTTVRHACALVEDVRELPRFELAISALEAGMIALARRVSGQGPVETGR